LPRVTSSELPIAAVDVAGRAREAPVASSPQFTIKFHVKPPRGEVRVLYVVRYVWDPNTRRALVHIPGPGDEWYRLNSSTILREDADGQWYYATDTWARAVHKALVSQHVAIL
jgi:hypothetical protein